MKKKIWLVAAVLLIFCGCHTKAEPIVEAPILMQDGQTVQTVVDKMANRIAIPMPADLDDTALKNLFSISPTHVQEYAGKISMEPGNMDHFVALRANPKKKRAVIKGLNRRLSDMQRVFSQNQTDEDEKILKGEIVEKGDYVFLAILCEENEMVEEDMQEMLGIIEEAF